MNPGFSAPGLGFVFGQQSGWDDADDFLMYAQNNNWLVEEPDFNNQYRETSGEKLNLKLTIEPLRDFRVELNTSWDHSTSYSTYNRWYDSIDVDDSGIPIPGFSRDSEIRQGNFSTSYSMISTSFVGDGDNYVNSVFEQFSANRVTISHRLAEESGYGNGTVDSTGYADGYGPNHPHVLIPAFLAAYSGKNAESSTTNVFAKTYIPNVRVTYSGLGKLPALRDKVRNVSLSSGYKSSYVVGGYTSNILFVDEGNGYTTVRDTANAYNNFVAPNTYNSVTIREAFSPLIGVDVTLKNSVQIRFDIKKDRTLNLSTRSLQVMEVRGDAYTLGLGYTFKNLRAPFQHKAKRKAITSDFKVRADFSLRNSLNITRQLDTEIQANNVTNGQRTYSMKLTGDYKLSRKLTLRLYFDYLKNTPAISLSYPNSTTNGGFSIRFNLNG